MKNYEEEKHLLNEEEALERFGGDAELYEELLTMFTAEKQLNPDIVEKLILMASASEAASIIHRLKGTAGTIGAEKLYESSSALELVLRGKAEGNPLPLLERTMQDYMQTTEFIKIRMQKRS